MRNKKVIILIVSIILVCLLGIGGFFFFSNNDFKLEFGKKENNEEVKEKLPNVEENENVIPEEKKLQVIDVDSNSRPIAVMINNHKSARAHHTGLQDAYLVYEIVVEGGLTRYLAVFKDKNTEKIGSVRSARHYFLDYALENDAIYVHWGWSPKAQSDISSLRVNNLNGLTYEGKYFYRDKSINVGYEHRGFTSMELINQGITKLKYRTTSDKETLLNYSIDEVNLAEIEGVQVANNVSVTYSNSVTTSYVYDSNSKTYLRFVNNVAHTDYATKQQYTAKNIITYQVYNHTLSGDVKGRQDLDNVGSGNGYYISNGYAVPIKWSKASRGAQTVYSLMDGTEINVNDGNTFIQIQPRNKKLIIE